MTETAEAIKIQRGLKGVYFDRSPCTFIDGKAGELRYRGYSIHDLAEHSSFEETAFLLLNGELPGRQQLAGLDAELKAARKLPAPVLDIIHAIKSAHPMDVLRTAASALSALHSRMPCTPAANVCWIIQALARRASVVPEIGKVTTTAGVL